MKFIRILILAVTCFFMQAKASPLSLDHSWPSHIYEMSDPSGSGTDDSSPGGPSPVGIYTPVVAILHKTEIEVLIDTINDPAVEAGNDLLTQLRNTDRCSSAASVA